MNATTKTGFVVLDASPCRKAHKHQGFTFMPSERDFFIYTMLTVLSLCGLAILF